MLRNQTSFLQFLRDLIIIIFNPNPNIQIFTVRYEVTLPKPTCKIVALVKDDIIFTTKLQFANLDHMSLIKVSCYWKWLYPPGNNMRNIYHWRNEKVSGCLIGYSRQCERTVLWCCTRSPFTTCCIREEGKFLFLLLPDH